MTLAEDGAPKVRPGVGWFGTAPSADAIDGACMHVMVDDVVHLLVIAGGRIYRSLNDGATWATCATSGAVEVVFTAGKKVHTEQANAYTYIFNGWDNIVRYDGTTTLAVYTALPTSMVFFIIKRMVSPHKPKESQNSNDVRTCVIISRSPTTKESNDDATLKRCRTASKPRYIVVFSAYIEKF